MKSLLITLISIREPFSCCEFVLMFHSRFSTHCNQCATSNHTPAAIMMNYWILSTRLSVYTSFSVPLPLHRMRNHHKGTLWTSLSNFVKDYVYGNSLKLKQEGNVEQNLSEGRHLLQAVSQRYKGERNIRRK